MLAGWLSLVKEKGNLIGLVEAKGTSKKECLCSARKTQKVKVTKWMIIITNKLLRPRVLINNIDE